jgi:cell division protein FtsQ
MLFMLSIPLVVGAFVFSNGIAKNQVYKGLKIEMKNPEVSFITQDDVLDILQENGLDNKNTFVKKVNVKTIEQQLEKNKWISDAVVFSSANGTLNLKITQKQPIIRIQQKDSNDYAYYLDQYANPIEWSEKYTPRVPIATSSSLSFSKVDLAFKSDLVKIATFIQKDTFWNAFITQIDIQPKHEINLIPVLGNQTILIGNANNLEDKMARLLAFYQHGFSTIDWNRFDEIDARFNGQIVCRNTAGATLSENPYDVNGKATIKADVTKNEDAIVVAKAIQTHKTSMPNVHHGTIKSVITKVKSKASKQQENNVTTKIFKSSNMKKTIQKKPLSIPKGKASTQIKKD